MERAGRILPQLNKLIDKASPLVYNETEVREADFMKKKTKMIIAVIVLLVAAAAISGGIYGFTQHNNTKQHNAVVDEIDLINAATNTEKLSDIDRDELSELLDRRVATGPYGQVEDAIKRYISDLYNGIFDTVDKAGNDALYSMLTAENIKSDGPEFEKSKELLESTIAQLNAGVENYIDLIGSDTVESYFSKTGLDGDYKKLYDTALLYDVPTDEESNRYIASLNTIISQLEATADVLDFLTANKGNWKMKDDTLVFKTQALYDEYNALCEKAGV